MIYFHFFKFILASTTKEPVTTSSVVVEKSEKPSVATINGMVNDFKLN